jgi:hypothetical protein
MSNIKKGRNEPTYTVSFGKEKLTPEQDREILAEYVFTLLRWQENERLKNEALNE